LVVNCSKKAAGNRGPVGSEKVGENPEEAENPAVAGNHGSVGSEKVEVNFLAVLLAATRAALDFPGEPFAECDGAFGFRDFRLSLQMAFLNAVVS
jgi:hypothetical protein